MLGRWRRLFGARQGGAPVASQDPEGSTLADPIDPLVVPSSVRPAAADGLLTQLRADGASFDTIFDSIHDAIALLDPVRDADGRLTELIVRWADAAWHELPGLGRHSVRADVGAALVASPGMDMGPLEQVLATGVPLRRDHPAASDRWVDVTFSRLGSQLLVVARDITERRRAETRLAEAEARLAAVLSTMSESIIVMRPVRDADGVLLDHTLEWANDAWFRRYGLGPEAVGRGVFELSPHHRALIPVHERVLATGEPEHLDFALPDGRWIAITFHRFGTSLMAVAHDITERKRAAAELEAERSALAHAQRIAHVGSWSVAGGWADRSWSAELFRIFGLPPAAEPPPTDQVLGSLGTDATPLVIARLTAAIDDGTPFEIEVTLSRPDGERRIVVINGERFIRPDGVAIARGSVADVTELRATQARLHAAERAEMVARLAGGVAHDYNNILAGITGFAGFLASSLPPDDDRREDALRIGEAAAKATALTRQLLAYSRHEVLHPVELDPARVVRAILPLARSACGEAVDVRFVEGGRARVHADQRVLEEALINLILNARDAMPDGGRVTIATRITGDEVEISVTDTGSGIPPEHLPHVFEPFYSTKELATGSGMGLASVEGAIAQSGGRVTLASAVGSGSTFTIHLPRVAAPADPPEATGTAAAGPRGSGTVLLVDDEQMVRVVVSRMLQALGYEVVIADRPAVALAIVEAGTTPFDAVLTDMLMPGMNGMELAAQILALRPEVPVVLMSGYSPETIFAGGLLPDGMPFLAKPFGPEALAAAIGGVLPQGGGSDRRG